MSDIVDRNVGEKLSFFKIFFDEKYKYKIIIPIIQRDYAQGRTSAKLVRDTFINALYGYLEDNIPGRDLDFVYGSLKKTGDQCCFIPLDGQQRLTTLFLLHWYLYQISDNNEKKALFKSTLLKNDKCMFTYETRSSSSEFCDRLMNYDLNINELVDGRISATIENESWYFMSWRHDPTIKSMLTMLDSIHLKFNNHQHYFERLLDTENPIITFLFLDLEEYSLSDDLYIKMNSRGKALTPFENFKAKFEQYLDWIDGEDNYLLDINGNEQTVSIGKYFSYNIDTKWANLFWEYRALQNRSGKDIDDNYDDELMNFIRVIFTNCYTENLKISRSNKDDSLEYLLGTSIAQKLSDYSDDISFYKYNELKVFAKKDVENDDHKNSTREIIKTLIRTLDIFSDIDSDNKKIRNYICNDYIFYFDENKIFENALKHDFENYHQRLCFYAYTSFLVYNNDSVGINEWMRFIHNVSHPENSPIYGANDFYSALHAVKTFIPHSNKILDYLKVNDSFSFFNESQFLEERIKAFLITKSDSWKEKIIDIEKHNYFNGQIGFLLEFSGIIKYFKANSNCDWDSSTDKKYFTTFVNYSEKANKVFYESYESRENDSNYVFERAVLSKGDYLTDASRYRKNLLSTSLTKNNIKRDHSWKRLLRFSEDDAWITKRSFVKDVFDDELFDIGNMEQSLELICKNKTNSWRDFFVSNPSIWSYCNQGFIRFEAEKDILLYRESQSNHMHTELFTFILWKKVIELKKMSYSPFGNVRYEEVKSIDDDPRIIFEDFCFDRKNYYLAVYHNINDSLPGAYEIGFHKSKGNKRLCDYNSSLVDIMDDCDFEWSDYDESFFCSFDEAEDLLEQLDTVIFKLNNI